MTSPIPQPEPWLSERTISLREKLDEICRDPATPYDVIVDVGVKATASLWVDAQCWKLMQDELKRIMYDKM